MYKLTITKYEENEKYDEQMELYLKRENNNYDHGFIEEPKKYLEIPFKELEIYVSESELEKIKKGVWETCC